MKTKKYDTVGNLLFFPVSKSKYPLRLDNKGICGRIITTKGLPNELYRQIQKDEVPISSTDLVQYRLIALERLAEIVPDFQRILEREVFGDDIFGIMAQSRKTMRNNLLDIGAIWLGRFTTSTSMVRHGEEIFVMELPEFYSCVDPNNPIVDGGFDLSNILQDIQSGKIPPERNFSVDNLPEGGEFSGTDFTEHPFVIAVLGSRELAKKYIQGLNALDSDGFHTKEMHSVWVPQTLPEGYGRPIALGLKGTAVYPPNHTTKGHSMIVVQK